MPVIKIGKVYLLGRLVQGHFQVQRPREGSSNFSGISQIRNEAFFDGFGKQRSNVYPKDEVSLNSKMRIYFPRYDSSNVNKVLILIFSPGAKLEVAWPPRTLPRPVPTILSS